MLNAWEKNIDGVWVAAVLVTNSVPLGKSPILSCAHFH